MTFALFLQVKVSCKERNLRLVKQGKRMNFFYKKAQLKEELHSLFESSNGFYRVFTNDYVSN